MNVRVSQKRFSNPNHRGGVSLTRLDKAWLAVITRCTAISGDGSAGPLLQILGDQFRREHRATYFKNTETPDV